MPSSSSPSPADAVPASRADPVGGADVELETHVGPKPRLWRSRTNRVVLGVIGGIAEKLGWEAKPLRILWSLVGVLTLPLGALPAIVPYLAIWGIAPVRGTPLPQPPFRRSRRSQMIAGVLGGLAERLGMRPAVVRVGYSVLTAATLWLPGIVTYLVLWSKTPLAEPDAKPDA